MQIRAKFTSNCRKCGQIINPGDLIEWERGTGSWHIKCPTIEQHDGPTFQLDGGSGYGCHGWNRGDIVLASESQISRGYPEFLFVISSRSEYIRDEGMSFGVGDEQGYVYSATCRAATNKESAPLRKRLERENHIRAARKALRVIKRRFRDSGDYPEGNHDLQGETIPIGRGRDIYGGGEWFVITDDHIWYVMNNSRDGDTWSANNVPGAIGCRLPRTTDLINEIRSVLTAAYPKEVD